MDYLIFIKKKIKALQDIESFSVEKIYNHKAVVEIENAGYNVMYELLDHFIPSILKPDDQRKSYDVKSFEINTKAIYLQ